MEREKLIKELETLLSGKSMKKLSGTPKKCYKYALTAIFINTCFGRQLTKGQEENFEFVYKIKEKPKEFNNDELLKHFKSTVEFSLKESHFYNHESFETIDNIIVLFRKIISLTKKQGTFLINVSELENIFDIKKAYEASHKHLQPHHWIEIDLMNGMIITVPEFFTYTDVVNNWNTFVDKVKEYNKIMNRRDGIPLIEKKNNPENRQLNYEIDTLSRTLWVSSVTFTESYLYYLFYNLKKVNYQPESNAAEQILKLQKVEDEQIIKRLIIPEFLNKNQELNRVLKKYVDINKIRNRFIHPSAFMGTSEKSELLPLITNSYTGVIETLETCKRLVEIIDESLPEELQILIWWDRVKHPVFFDYKKGSIVNPDSIMGKIKYNS